MAAADTFQAERILCIKLRGIGDTVLSLPAVHALRRGFPSARLACLVPAAAVEVLSCDPAVSEVIPYQRDWFRSFRHHLAVYEGLQRRRFDLAVCLHASFRTALIGWMSGARWRVVRNHSGRDWFSNVACLVPKEPKSIIERDMDALRALGIEAPAGPPVMALAPWAEAEAASLARALGLDGRRALALLPGGAVPERRWPQERFLGLARILAAHGYRPLLVAPPDQSLHLPASFPKAVKAARIPSLQVLGALFRRLGAAIGNNSGGRHVAAACGARTMTLFHWERLREWHPYRNEDGHWALQPASGRIEDLSLQEVAGQALRWLAGSRARRRPS
jgi:ADP-heptose:LPS heptosyltransferase